jgi:hypothetical protein
LAEAILKMQKKRNKFADNEDVMWYAFDRRFL